LFFFPILCGVELDRPFRHSGVWPSANIPGWSDYRNQSRFEPGPNVYGSPFHSVEGEVATRNHVHSVSVWHLFLKPVGGSHKMPGLALWNLFDSPGEAYSEWNEKLAGDGPPERVMPPFQRAETRVPNEYVTC
jgi:hypothetical protein